MRHDDVDLRFVSLKGPARLWLPPDVDLDPGFVVGPWDRPTRDQIAQTPRRAGPLRGRGRRMGRPRSLRRAG